MNIGILSMQRVNNHGSLLQSYALKKLIEKKGSNVSFIDIVSFPDDKVLISDTLHNSDYEHKSKLSKIDKYFLNRLKTRIIANKQKDIFEIFRKIILKINSTQKEEVDLCIIGSDEVFNCLSQSSWGFTSQLFGNVPQAVRVITYAASCGATTYEKLPQGVISRIKETFPRIEGVSVRDRNTKDFVSHFTKREIYEHLDPVLIGDFTEEIEKSEMPFDIRKPYCVVYSYYNRIHNSEEIHAIKDFCRNKGLDIIAVGAPQMWIRNYYPMTPFQVLKTFQNASFVVTDTFHGTIFSYKYAKKFAVMLRESNKNKLSDLITRLDITKHLSNAVELNDSYKINHNPDKIKSFLLEEREKSLQYLTNFIKLGL